MYPPELVSPMKADLVNAGFTQLESAEAVENELATQDGTTLLVFNSVCGCAAGAARPAIKLSLSGEKKPSKLLTVFAGVDQAAVAKAREFTLPYPPSSP